MTIVIACKHGYNFCGINLLFMCIHSDNQLANCNILYSCQTTHQLGVQKVNSKPQTPQGVNGEVELRCLVLDL